MMNALEEVIENNEEVVNRICANTAASAVIDNRTNSAIVTSFDPTTTNGLIRHVCGTLVDLARSSVRDVDPFDDLQFLRIKTKNCEYIVGPEEEFTIIVQQN